jgi:S1-C subfamily serine protease
VIEGAQTIQVRGIQGDFSTAYTARVVLEDRNNDLALLSIDDARFTGLGTVPYLFQGKSVDVGTSIFVLGYPLRASMGDEIKLTNGIISSKSGFQGDATSYQISAPVQPGNSGGPLFDAQGNLVGIVNAKHEGAENVSYAVKASYLLSLIERMNKPPVLPTVSKIAGKPLTEQVKVVRKFTYIIETE